MRDCRRCFLFVWAALGWIVLMLPGGAAGQSAFYVLAPDASGQRVLRVAVEVAGGEVAARQNEPLAVPFEPRGLAAVAGGRRVIVSGSSAAEDAHFAHTLVVGPGGRIDEVATSRLPGPTRYTSVDRTGRFFLFTDYRSGAAGVHRIGAGGRVDPVLCGRGALRPTAHSILTTPDNRFAYVPCVKDQNALYQYAFDATAGTLTPLEPFDARPPAMFGPRHVAFHPSLSIAYFSNEQQLGVSVYAIAGDGRLEGVQYATTRARRAPYVRGVRGLHASDLVLSRDGTRLFVAIRDFAGDDDCVYSFDVVADGRLSLVAQTRVGDIPWALALAPGGRHLLVSEVGDRRLSIYDIEPEGGLILASRVDWDAAVRDLEVVAADRGSAAR